ncbi:amino acid ABC transporter permease [Brucellaceae bacterium C25G]
MTKQNLLYVREKLAPQEFPPNNNAGLWAWMRANLLSTPLNTIFTIFAVLLLWWFVPPLMRWLFIDAVWTGSDRFACLTTTQGGELPEGWSGACWAFVQAKYQQFLYGRYPIAERWRVDLTALLFVILLVPLMVPFVKHKVANAVLFFICFPIVAFFLLVGGYFGLSYVETPLWGGLLVTLVISFVGITVSLPLGVLLALARRSNLPVIKALSIIFIETVRGVPLVTVLFMASVMLPLFLPAGVTFDKLMRALIGVALFASAYMAEVVRGGLQAIPKGQYEGAEALGLSYWHKTGLIILPQALKMVIPGIVNTFIGLFKDTSLVYIIGMFDLLGIVRQNFSDANWATPQTPVTGLVFAAFVFWIFCFGMSRYSIFMERRLDTGHKR